MIQAVARSSGSGVIILRKNPSSTQLILFDLDGVLLDSQRNMEIAWQAVCGKHGVTRPFADYFALIGRPYGDIMKLLGLAHLMPEIERTYRVASLQNIGAAQWYPGVAEMLTEAEAAGLRLGIVTSKEMARTRSLLALLPVDFWTIQTPVAAFRGKPAPDHLMIACAEANSDPGETVYVGDMDSDYEAARRAGIRYVHAAWGYGALPGPDCQVARDVPALLPLILNRSPS